MPPAPKQNPQPPSTPAPGTPSPTMPLTSAPLPGIAALGVSTPSVIPLKPAPGPQAAPAPQPAPAPQAARVLQSAPTASPLPKHRKRKFVVTLCISILVLLIIGLSLPLQLDLISGLGYNPDPQMEEIIEELNLSLPATVVLRAVQPDLQDRAEFAESGCNDSLHSEISTLGCYDGSNIYIYDSQNSELDGLEESTTAHELLHAIWDRMPGFRKDIYEPILQDFYDHHRDHLEKYMSAYSTEAFYDELHSVVGTEFAASELPPTLREHYELFFNDFASLYPYYAHYTEAIEKNEQCLTELSAQIAEYDRIIEQRKAFYDQRFDQINRSIDLFNVCADTPGCFYSNADFNYQRSLIEQEISELENFRNDTQRIIDEANQYVHEYNRLALHYDELMDSIDSRSDQKLDTLN